MSTKIKLRRLFQLKRLQIDYHYLSRRNVLLIKKFLTKIDCTKLKYIHIYLPMISRKEFDTKLLIKEIRKINPTVTFIIPKVVKNSRKMDHYIYNPDIFRYTTKLNKFGIEEPDLDQSPIDESLLEKIDLVITPLLTIDESGYRLGYGGGYYDRFLGQLKSINCNFISVGIGYFEPINKLPEINEYDQPLDHYIY